MKKLIMMFLIVISFAGCEFVAIETIPRGGDYSDYEWELPEKFNKLFIGLDNLRTFAPELTDAEIIEIITCHVDALITYKKDSDIWNYRNVWQLPETTWNLKTGDCEDKAILTMYLVYKYLGVKGEIGRLAKNKSKNISHAILLVSLKEVLFYIDSRLIFSDIAKLSPYNVKEIISYGEALWIADTMEEEYELL